MLSLGKLATGQAGYYLEQAQGSLSRAQSVSSGVEDYYLGGPEAAGEWMGAGAGALGLNGQVGGAALNRVLAGEHPATGAPLGRVLAARRPGFDLTFSAPKSVSVLYGIGDDRLRSVLQKAHDRAVRDALGYLEREAAVTRRGPAGVHGIAGNGFVAAGFRHRTSRAGDPQLHTHVLIANLTLGVDGQWSTLDGRRIYAHAKTAGYLYEARLRALLTRGLGVGWTPVRNGIGDVAGVPRGVLRAFSRRRTEIEAELERRGASGAAAAQVATLATRRDKDYRVTPEQLVPEWRERAASLGLPGERIRELTGRSSPQRLDPGLERLIADALAGPDGLTQRRSTFTRRDVVQGFCGRLPAGADVTVAEIERAADRFLASERAVVLAVGERRSASAATLRRSDGRLVPLVRGERVYSTPELLRLEQRIIDHAESTRDDRLAVARTPVVERALARRPTISGEQEAMVRRLTLEGDGVALVLGQAGSGKTFALAAAREAWEASGRVVIGAAVARRAAGQLEDSSGIPSTSVAALLAELDGRPRGLPHRAVLVIDEAGMIPTRQLARLVEHAARARAKLVLVGDHRQLPEIEAGGAFRALTTRLPIIELRDNRRQTERWERDALALLRDGRVDDALELYEDHGRVVEGGDANEVRRRLVADWWAARDPDDSVMIAHRRADVADLNGRARALMSASGALGDVELRLDAGDFAAGDRAVLRRNDRRLGVANGDRGTVTAVDPAARTLDIELAGRTVQLDAGYLDSAARHGAAIQHAYAITGHVAQGLTFRQTFVLATDRISREWGYSALSRGRASNRLYAVTDEPEERAEYAPGGGDSRTAREQLAVSLGRSAAQTFATDAGREQRLAAELARVIAQHDVAADSHEVAVQALRELERRPPHPLRRRARREYRQELARARGVETYAGQRLDALEQLAAELREQIERERDAGRPREAAVAPENVRGQWLSRRGLERPEGVLERARKHDRGIGR